MTKRGFLLGKFLPPHAGHVFMCETAALLCDQLTVLVCSIDAEPIPGALRAAWMADLLPGCRVLHMHREIPQEPADHPDFWAIWRAAIREFHPEPIDEVYGSEPYVFRLAAELEASPILIDPEREIFSITGTAVRADPVRHWDMIPGPVRPYFQKRICLTGPESTGKSTLATRLAAHFSTRCMLEYGRAYDVHYRQGSGWELRHFVDLAVTHMAMRKALASSAGPLFFEDTDPLQTAVWSLMLMDEIDPALQAILDTMDRPDLYLLLSPEVAWVNDGTRYFGDMRERVRFHGFCERLLRDHGFRFETIEGGDWDDRFRHAALLCQRMADIPPGH